MRTHIPAQSHLEQRPSPLKSLPCLIALLPAFSFLIPSMLNASMQSTSPRATPHKSAQAHKSASMAKRPAAVPQKLPETAAPPAPKAPNWPANDHPTDAKVVWNSQGLRIDAANSSLSQILNEVSTVTGTKVEGLGPGDHASDQRIFGTYGPGPARDVLRKLLYGSGYNILMIGDQGQGTPRSIVLSAQTRGGPPQASNNEPAAVDENADAADQPEEPQPQPPSIRNGFAPGAPPRTPQQIMQEMQQRQQQGTPPQ